MKKILAILALATFGTAHAASVIMELQSWENPNTKATTGGLALTVKENFTDRIAGDVLVSISKSDSTKVLAGRSETGLTYSQPLVGQISGYVRSGIGLKHVSGSNDTGYYFTEPGVIYKVSENLSARLGWRYRSAFSDNVADQTHTVRAGLNYTLSKTDAVGIRYDQIRGDAAINTLNFNYTRSF